MLALGIILVLLALGALIAALVGGSDDRAFFDLGLFGVETNTLGVFLIGAATVLLLVVGLEMVRAGTRRATRHRREKKELNRLHQELASREGAAPAGKSTAAAAAGDPTAGRTTDAGEESPSASAAPGVHAAPSAAREEPPATAETVSTTDPTTRVERPDKGGPATS